MSIALIGGTGQFGSLVARQLAGRDADVVVQGRSRPAAGLPAEATFVAGDVLDVDFMRALLTSVDTVFIVLPAVPDEAFRALLTLSLVSEAGIERVVYVSMMGADDFTLAPRAAAKHVAERAIASLRLPTTILRPNAAFQNDALIKDAIVADRVYSTPLGEVGVTMIDARDVAELAALEVWRRHQAPTPLPTQTIDLVGPETLTGGSMAALWSGLVGGPVRYVGDDLTVIEQGLRSAMSPAEALDLRLVFDPLVRDGVLGEPGAAARLSETLQRPLRTYRSFAEELLGE